MSLLESVLACLTPGDVDMQWFCLATLFAASIVTVLLYLLQYSFGIFRVWTPSRTCGAFPESEEADRLLSWALSLKNWKSQWQEAWFTSINKEAKRIGVSVYTSIDVLCTSALFQMLKQKDAETQCF